jgi:hypothetical protein
MDVVRPILLHVEEAREPIQSIPGCAPEVFAYNAALLIEAGFLEGKIIRGPKGNAFAAFILRMTWQGHELLDAARNDSVWQIAKEKMLKPGMSWTFDLLREVLKTLAKQQLARVGLPGFDA